MKYRIVLVPFPFDDLSSVKVRPAVCLTDEIEPYGHIVLAFITSSFLDPVSATDLAIFRDDEDFATTGLKVDSTIRLHRLMTVASGVIRRQLGKLSTKQERAIEDRLRTLFGI